MTSVGKEARVACVVHDLTQVGGCGLDRGVVVSHIVCFPIVCVCMWFYAVFSQFFGEEWNMTNSSQRKAQILVDDINRVCGSWVSGLCGPQVLLR